MSLHIDHPFMSIRGSGILFIVVAAVFAISLLSAQCVNCQQNASDDLRMAEGNVTAINAVNSSISLQGGIDMTFNLSSDTEIRYGGNIINLSDIGIGDYVTVSYYRRGTDSRIPAKVISVTVKYKRSGRSDFSERPENQYGSF